MARGATARLYDVDEDSVKFEKLDQRSRYDQGRITFHARQGKLIDLDKLHESIWATRLSGGTRSGLVSLEVTAVGQIVTRRDEVVLAVSGSDAEFVLGPYPDDGQRDAYRELHTVAADRVVKVTGLIDGYQGRWPGLLREKPKKPRRILVKGFEVIEEKP